MKSHKNFDHKVNFPSSMEIPDSDSEDENVSKHLVTRNSDKALKVTELILFRTSNTREHRTDLYHWAREYLIVRRGQKFKIKIQFNRKIDSTNDTIMFEMVCVGDKHPSNVAGSLQQIIPKKGKDLGAPNHWGSTYYTYGNQSIVAKIKPASDCPIGKWKMKIRTKFGDQEASHFKTTYFYILFNPWCPNDVVYLANEEHLQEYMLGDMGMYWMQSDGDGIPWRFGHFDKNILPCVLMILKLVTSNNRVRLNDPVEISRLLAHYMRYVVVGKWSEGYSDGTSPYDWQGSSELLNEFYQTKYPVKYGQCWVFAGVLTTVLRALGIPTRMITNMYSAVDTNVSMTIDQFVDKKGSLYEFEHIWNFHVWIEVWMKRLDLGVANINGKYDGWQAIDPGLSGPISIAALREADLSHPFNPGELYANFNADIVIWEQTSILKPMKIVHIDSTTIGETIMTKAVKSDDYEDLTFQYKDPEGSEEERNLFLKALQQSNHDYSRFYMNKWFSDVEIAILTKDIKFGEPMRVTLQIINKSVEKNHKIQTTLNIYSVLYDGSNPIQVKQKNFNKSIASKSTKNLKVVLKVSEYKGFLQPLGFFRFTCLLGVEGTNFECFEYNSLNVSQGLIKSAPKPFKFRKFFSKIFFK